MTLLPAVTELLRRRGTRHAVVGAAALAVHVHEIEGLPVPVATRADLVLLELYAGGPQDAWDIEPLIAEADSATLAEVGDRLAALPAEARRLWQRIRRGG